MRREPVSRVIGCDTIITIMGGRGGMTEAGSEKIRDLILKCHLPKEMSYYIAKGEPQEVVTERFLEFSRDLRETHGPEFLNSAQRQELFNSVCTTSVKSHMDIVLAYRRFSEVLLRLHEKRTIAEGAES